MYKERKKLKVNYNMFCMLYDHRPKIMQNYKVGKM